MRNDGNIGKLVETLKQMENQLRKNRNSSKANGLGIYSNMNLAFYKLHTLRYLERLNSSNGKGITYDFLNQFIKLCDFYTSIKDACDLFKERLNKVFTKYVVEQVSAKVGYRFVTGMGYPSPVENGMLFHHVYGVPYIHGESVKGLVRYAYLLEKFPDLIDKPKNIKDYIKELEEGEYEEDPHLQEEYSLIFGDKTREGSVVFFDAYPTEIKRENFVIDIINPHYGEYYKSKGEKPAVDWDKPNPIFFLTLENVEFCFTIGFDPLKLNKDNGKALLEKVSSYLKWGLEMFGLGSKRRKGYGWFEIN